MRYEGKLREYHNQNDLTCFEGFFLRRLGAIVILAAILEQKNRARACTQRQNRCLQGVLSRPSGPSINILTLGPVSSAQAWTPGKPERLQPSLILFAAGLNCVSRKTHQIPIQAKERSQVSLRRPITMRQQSRHQIERNICSKHFEHFGV